jgi:hypothetical protein
VSNTYQKASHRTHPDPQPGEVTVPEQVAVSMIENSGAAKLQAHFTGKVSPVGQNEDEKVA